MRIAASRLQPLVPKPVSAYNICMDLRKLPIGIQDFVSIREDDYLYVDKTPIVHRLVQEGKVYFLSRPRRAVCIGNRTGPRTDGKTGVRYYRRIRQAAVVHHRQSAALCGITEEELLNGFRPEIDEVAKQEGISYDDCVERIREWYNGYRFHPEGPAVYNPFSTLNLFSFKEFQDFWFQTGTPTFLVELLKKTDTDLREIDGIELPARDFADYRADPDRPLPVIYQSGYLTIKRYDKRRFLYTLGYPNAEVERGFLFFVLPSYSSVSRDKSGFHISRFADELEAGDVDAFMERLKCFFESTTHGNCTKSASSSTKRKRTSAGGLPIFKRAISLKELSMNPNRGVKSILLSRCWRVSLTTAPPGQPLSPPAPLLLPALR